MKKDEEDGVVIFGSTFSVFWRPWEPVYRRYARHRRCHLTLPAASPQVGPAPTPFLSVLPAASAAPSLPPYYLLFIRRLSNELISPLFRILSGGVFRNYLAYI